MRNVTATWRALAIRAPDVDAHALAAARPSTITDDGWTRYVADIIVPFVAMIRALEPAIVGLAGPPGSGKTTLARCLTSALGPQAITVSMDDFYLSRAEREEKGLRFRGGVGSHDLGALVTVLNDVRSGRAPVTIPRYDTHADDRTAPEVLEAVPRPLIVEGYFLGYGGDGYDEVAELLDVLVFIDVDVDTSRERRFDREAQLRQQGGGLTETDMQAFWDDVLAPGIERLVPAARAAADVLLAITADQGVRAVVMDERRVDLLDALTRPVSGPDAP